MSLLLVSLLVIAAAEPEKLELKILRDDREAIVYAPSKPPQAVEELVPLVFCFHGRGANMYDAANTYRMHRQWPQAVVVYMDGLRTPGKYDKEGELTGWQRTAGDQMDRDLLFFDAVLERIKQTHPIDPQRIYVAGHSSGGDFTYLLWAARYDVLAAVAPSATTGDGLVALNPLPCFHIAGENDSLANFKDQLRAMRLVRRINRCDPETTPWAEGVEFYDSEIAPFASLIHSRAHKFAKESPALIVKFFKSNIKPPQP